VRCDIPSRLAPSLRPWSKTADVFSGIATLQIPLAFRGSVAQNAFWWCAIKTMPKQRSHVHASRSYWGEFDAGQVVDWLNSKTRPAGDPVEKLIRLNAQLPGFDSKMRPIERELRSFFSALVGKSKLAVAPVLKDIAPNHWTVQWGPVGRMYSLQALAVIKLLHLADKGLLGRVRACGRKECGEWFYAKFAHQRFHSERCQQEAYRSDPEWKHRRAEDMKRLRNEKKLREQRWLRAPKGKGQR
jgi:hypothetical protein